MSEINNSVQILLKVLEHLRYHPTQLKPQNWSDYQYWCGNILDPDGVGLWLTLPEETKVRILSSTQTEGEQKGLNLRESNYYSSDCYDQIVEMKDIPYEHTFLLLDTVKEKDLSRAEHNTTVFFSKVRFFPLDCDSTGMNLDRKKTDELTEFFASRVNGNIFSEENFWKLAAFLGISASEYYPDERMSDKLDSLLERKSLRLNDFDHTKIISRFLMLFYYYYFPDFFERHSN